MPYVNQRWLGGMLTNFVTIRKRLGLLDQLEARQENGEFERLSKKEASKLTDEMTKLQRTLGGMRKMRRLPGAMFVIDPQREHIAVVEARKLEIPVIGTGDTNVDPDMLDYVIPANDDAIRAIRLLCQLVADAADRGRPGARRTAGRGAHGRGGRGAGRGERRDGRRAGRRWHVQLRAGAGRGRAAARRGGCGDRGAGCRRGGADTARSTCDGRAGRGPTRGAAKTSSDEEEPAD